MDDWKIDLKLLGEEFGLKKKFFESYKHYRIKLLEVFKNTDLTMKIKYVEVKGTIKL